MPLKPEQLAQQLQRELAPIYLVGGEEPLLVQESCASILAAARAQGYQERELLSVETGFDWQQLLIASQSMSLFSEKRIVELRLPSAKPGDAGSKVLQQLAADPPVDTLILLQLGKLDGSSKRSKWFKAIEAAGCVVVVYALASRELPAWMERRLQQQGLTAGPGVAQQLAYHFEGNLLAAAQEIERLGLLYEGTISVDDVLQGLRDNARFTVFGLADACLAGDGKAVLRMLDSLRAEAVAPPLVLWALVRELRNLAALAQRLAQGEAESGLWRQYAIWPQRQSLFKQALRRLRPAQCLGLLQRAARVDRVIKGRLAGNPWQELQVLSLALCGLRAAGAQILV